MNKLEICKTCGTRLIVKQTKRTASQLKKPYYYTAYYFCSKCQKLYHDDKFKIVNEQTPLFGGETPLPGEKVQSTRDTRDTRATRDTYDVEIWTDGACVYNGQEHAKAAWAFVALTQEGTDYEEAGAVEGRQTNNVAEALAIYHAFLWASKKSYKKIIIYSDSQISLNNMKKSPSKVKMNAEIFEEIAKLIKKFDLNVHLEKVLGHSGDVNNERADKLANKLAMSMAKERLGKK